MHPIIRSFAAVASLAMATSAWAQARSTQIEVLGVTPGAPLAQVEAKLKAQGYRFGRDDRFAPCSRTHSTIMAPMVKERKSEPNQLSLECRRVFTKGDGFAEASYLTTSQGWMLHQLKYYFKSSEQPRDIYDRLTAKFGPATQRNSFSRNTWLPKGKGGPEIQYLGDHGSHEILLLSGSEARNAHSNMIKAELQRRLPKTKADL